MASIELGLFDIQQVDPLSDLDHQATFNQRLNDLAFADELGISIAFVAERHYLPTYRCQASSIWLGAASQRTTSMRLGVLAYTLPITPPVRLAEEIAVLDQLTGGRIEVGIGLGHRAEELVANGVDPEDRITIFQERLAIMEGLWAGGEVTSKSSHSPVANVFLHPTPVQQPHPPLWFAGTQANAAMWAGQHGMNLAIGFAPGDRLFGATASFRHGLAIRKTRPMPEDNIRRGQIALMRQVYIGPTDKSVRREMTADLMRLGELDQPGTAANRADRKRQAGEQYDRLIKENIFIAGAPETVARAIVDARNQLGSNLFLANVYAAGIDQDRVRRTMTLLAGPVRDEIDSLTTRV
jgi:alkanesulfonate monooxygenase SsuD/methylene tetrahydromethanopterin reductase-like flavin-dependent oxidoreductase (luciferase family)